MKAPKRPREPISSVAGWAFATVLALMWGLGPALPAMMDGLLLGNAHTDLYPSVWGLHWFASQQPGLPLHLDLLAAPEGMAFYYSSPIHGWLAWPLLQVFELATTFNLLVVAARVASVLCTYGWLQAAGFVPAGALAGAALYGCAAMFHGYAVEGIIEGVDAWTLPLWAWAVARGRFLISIPLFSLVILSNWYLGLAGVLVASFWGLKRSDALFSGIAGGVLAMPLWASFTSAFPDAAPLEPAIRAAMGATLSIPSPGWTHDYPFAMTAYFGWLAAALVCWKARENQILAFGVAVCAVLSLGIGPWYDLPILERVRFPYRLIAASLFLAAPLVAKAAEDLPTRMLPLIIGPLIAIESWGLSPTEPIIPGADASIPAIYDEIPEGVLLEVPGPVAMPPGEINLSRARAKYLLYYQTRHGRSSPWAPDFNGLSKPAEPEWLKDIRAYDPYDPYFHIRPKIPLRLDEMRAAGVRSVMVQPKTLGTEAARRLETALVAAGAKPLQQTADFRLFVLEDPPGIEPKNESL